MFYENVYKSLLKKFDVFCINLDRYLSPTVETGGASIYKSESFCLLCVFSM